MVEINESNYHKILKKKLGNFENYEYMGGYTTKKNVIKNELIGKNVVFLFVVCVIILL